MKIDKYYFKIALYAFAVLAGVVLLENILKNFGIISGTTYILIDGARRLASPFIIGFSIAYLINPCVMFFERKLFHNAPSYDKYPGSKRVISIGLTYALVIGGVTWLLIYFIPELKNTLTTFFYQLPKQQVNLKHTVNVVFDQIDFINSEDINKFLDALLKPIQEFNSKDVPKMLQAIFDGTMVAASTLLNIILGIFIAFYMLIDKEKTAAFLKKTIYALFPQKSSEKFLKNIKRVHQLFQSFIVGKTLDSSIIGIICLAGMTLMKAPYATIISLIVGITNMIPYFGPFIGAVPAVLMTLLIEPSKAIWVALFILALQQFDGIILGPKILGDSTGLGPLWIIFSIIVGGALIGPLGMFLGVPIFASIKLFFTEYIEERYQKKIAAEKETTEEELS